MVSPPTQYRDALATIPQKGSGKIKAEICEEGRKECDRCMKWSYQRSMLEALWARNSCTCRKIQRIKVIRRFLSFRKGVQSRETNTKGLTMKEFQTIRRLMAQLETNTNIQTPSIASVLQDISASASGMIHSSSQIIDSGAIDQMIGLHTLFSTYSTCCGRDKVMIGDGSISFI